MSVDYRWWWYRWDEAFDGGLIARNYVARQLVQYQHAMGARTL